MDSRLYLAFVHGALVHGRLHLAKSIDLADNVPPAAVSQHNFAPHVLNHPNPLPRPAHRAAAAPRVLRDRQKCPKVSSGRSAQARRTLRVILTV
eukprot:1189726-Prorocentrum_minimum.AAC.8